MNIESPLLFNYKFSSQKIEVFIISVFWALLFASIFFNDYSFLVYSPKSLVLSQATQDEIDIGRRVELFYKLIFFVAASSFIFYSLINKAYKRFLINRKSLQTTLVLSSIGEVLIFSDLIGLMSKHSIYLIAILSVISIALIIIGKVFSILRFLNNTLFFSFIAICAFLISIAVIFLFNSTISFYSSFLFVYFSSFLILLLITLLLKIQFKFSFRKLISMATALSFIPVLVFFVIEFQFYYHSNFSQFIRYKILFVTLFIALSIVWYLVHKRNSFRKSSYYFLNNYLIPFSLLGFLLFTVYKPFVGFSGDVFELANPANAVLRIFKFKEIPLIDFMSSHMLSEQIFSWIYFAVFGYSKTLDFTAYFFLSDVLFAFAAFWFLKYIFNNGLLALLFLIFFPLVGMLFSDSIFISIFAFFVLQKAQFNQSTKSFFILFSTLLILIIWRLDTGIAALFTSFVFFPVILFVSKTELNLKNFLLGFLLFLLTVLFFFVVSLMIRDFSTIKNNFLSALHYISQNQAHGYSKIANEINTTFYFYHFFIPALSILCIIVSIAFLRLNWFLFSSERKFIFTSSIFLFLICLSNFQRGLVRHSFYEGSEHFLVSTFFIALSLFSLALFRTEKSNAKFMVMLHISFFLLLSLKFTSFDKNSTQIEHLITTNTLLNIDKNFNEKNYSGRIVTDGNSFANFGNFLTTEFKSNQSFLDFSNTPMMYFFTQRKVPSYFCQPLQNSVDDYLQNQFLDKINTSNTPLVVYSNYPKNWFDETDGVPNSLRQYLIAEYVYNNYKPFSIIDSKSVWIDKKLNLSSKGLPIDTICSKPQVHNYKKASKLINRYFQKQHSNQLMLLATSYSNYNTEFNFSYFNLPKNIDYSKGVFAKVFLTSSRDLVNVKLLTKKNYSFVSEIVFEADKTSNSYMVRLSNHYLWHLLNPDHIVVECEKGTVIEKIEFYYDNRF